MRPCICSAGFGSWYPRGLSRLHHTLTDQGYTGGRVFFADGDMPPDTPEHADAPYAFKLSIMRHANKVEGFDGLLWADASMYAIAPLTNLWRRIERDGYVLFNPGQWNCAQWATDDCLRIMGVTRDESEKIPQVVGGLCGFSLTHANGKRLFEAWEYMASHNPLAFRGKHTNDDKSCSNDPRCLGHRHDQTILSILAHKQRLHLTAPPMFYSWHCDEPGADTCIVNRGM